MNYLYTPEEFLAWEPDSEAVMFHLLYYYKGLTEFTPCVVAGDVSRIKSFLQKMTDPKRYAKLETYSTDPLSKVKIEQYDADGDPI